jgi:hypothetical protein
VVDLSGSGITRQRQVANTGRSEAVLVFDDVALAEEDRLGGPEDGASIVDWLVLRSTAALPPCRWPPPAGCGGHCPPRTYGGLVIRMHASW